MSNPPLQKFQVVTCPNSELSFTNRAIINPVEIYANVGHIAVRYPSKQEAFVFSLQADPAVEKGKLAFNLSSRKWASLMVGSQIEAAPYLFEPDSQCLNVITFYTDFATKQNAPTNTEFDTDAMGRQFKERFSNQAFTVGQLFGFPFQVTPNKKVTFELKVKELEALTLDRSHDVATSNVEIGLTTANTVFMFERAEGSEVRLTGGLTGMVAAPRIFNQNWDFASMGVGGLSEQFNTMFRRAFASRLLPPQYAEAIGIKHVKGILLYGPPGTGKTLIAREIGKMLLAREPKIVNGPEVLNKYVGESEANIRKLFEEAEEEQAKMGINSSLHMIIFDEIDAICKARGNSASTSGVGDNVVNQLLSKIDGVNALHNVLLVGMTNRKDLIDEALLRPGRLELQIEIGLPNESGRLEILKIHTNRMKEKGLLDASVKLEELASKAKNYTGAEIAGLIGAATSHAINQIVTPDSANNIDKEKLDNVKITKEHFEIAMKQDVKPALGASEDKLRELARPIIIWDPQIKSIQSDMDSVINTVRNNSTQMRPYYVLVVGEPGSGLTTLAANMAANTHFPFIRVYQAESTADKTESAKVQYMKKLFQDAARSEDSCILMDDLEYILDYCHIGPRFSNTSRAVLATNKRVLLPVNHRMLVICTAESEQFLADLQLTKVFDDIIKVPSLTSPEHVFTVLSDLLESGNLPFTKEQLQELISALGSIPFKMGIRELETLAMAAIGDEPDQRVNMFLRRIQRLKLIVRESRLDPTFRMM